MKNILLMTLCVLGLFTACKNADSQAKTDKATETTVAPPPPPPPPPPAVAADPNTKCYLMTENKDSSVVQLTINGDAVTGFYDWQPFEKDGAHGILKGTVKNGVINADYTYFIEGSKQIEAKMYKLEADGTLVEGEGELTDKGGKLVMKNPAKVKWAYKYPSVDCGKVSHTIDMLKEMAPDLK